MNKKLLDDIAPIKSSEKPQITIINGELQTEETKLKRLKELFDWYIDKDSKERYNYYKEER